MKGRLGDGETGGLHPRERTMIPDPTANLPLRRRLQLARRNWEHRGRDALLAVLRWFLATPASTTPPPSSPEARGSIRRVLIIRTGRAIGDAVLSLVLLPECRALFPGARVDLLLRDNVSPLFREGTDTDTLLELHPRFLLWPVATFRLLRDLRMRRYDLVIACDNPHKSSFTTLCLTLWTGARWRVGFENEESRTFLNVTVPRVERQAVVTNLLRLLEPFGGTTRSAVPRWTANERLRREAGAEDGDTVPPVIIFAPDHWRKSWPLERFVTLARAITDRGHRTRMAFGPGDGRAASAAVTAWIAESKGLGGVLAPQPLPIFAATLARCRLFVSNDCGPYHVAVAAGARCVAAFRSRETRGDFGYEEAGKLVALHDDDPEKLWTRTRDEALRMLEGD